ncbi:MAG TPA: hypothetical protein P5121_32420 [Caldilineaceae bacterium]|nr:hypothetical protein [Caldilineaceae bacterium]
MRSITQNCFRTVRGTLFSGLRLGLALALAYSAGFAFYAIVRSSWQIVASLSLAEGLIGTLMANAFALVVAVLFFALLLGTVAALLQSITLLLVDGLARLLFAQRSPIVMAGLGLVVAGVLAGALQLLVQRSLGSYFVALWPTGYFFWLGLPSLLFVAATVWIGWHAAGHGVEGQLVPIGTAVSTH